MTRPLLTLLLAACGHAPEAPAPTAPPDLGVAWIAPRVATQQVLVTLPGEVEPSPDSTTLLGPRVAARIVRWEVGPGDTVRAGDRLAWLDSPTLAGLEATVDGRRRVRDAMEARVTVGVGTRAEVAEADAALGDAAATLAATRSTLRAGASGTAWTSPATGVVGALGCAQGEEVGPSHACVTLVDPTHATVLVRVPERHLGRLDGAVGHWHGTDGRTLEALPFGMRAPVADRASRTVAVRFLVPEDVDPLTPYTSGRVDVVVPLPEGAWAVPERAVTVLDRHKVVFLRRGETGEAVQVEVLGRMGEDLIVRGDLTATDEVAWRGVIELKSIALLGEAE